MSSAQQWPLCFASEFCWELAATARARSFNKQLKNTKIRARFMMWEMPNFSGVQNSLCVGTWLWLRGIQKNKSAKKKCKVVSFTIWEKRNFMSQSKPDEGLLRMCITVFEPENTNAPGAVRRREINLQLVLVSKICSEFAALVASGCIKNRLSAKGVLACWVHDVRNTQMFGMQNLLRFGYLMPHNGTTENA